MVFINWNVGAQVARCTILHVLVDLTAGWQASEVRLDFVIVKILYRLNYLDFYFVDVIGMLLIVLEMHSAFLKQRCILWCVNFV